ncbi:DLGAP1 [Mytilus coruscus]|uniref:DLGAP1 n=1 Tax=Mytilus coruscus TaxID=42192 RepID=A0A6J8DGP7_MYTCO|nr:DLGAP1 [Mytilus coruscus]
MGSTELMSCIISPVHTCIRRISTEEEEDDNVFLDEGSDQKMKKTQKRRTVLFIPGFRKSKKTTVSSENDAPQEQMIVLGNVCRDADSVLYNRSNHDTDTQVKSSSRSSISSLDTLVSIDSGVDCGQISTSSLSSIESLGSSYEVMNDKNCKPHGRAPIASPEDDLLLDEAYPKHEKDNSKYENLTFTHNNSASSFCTLSDNNSSCTCGSCCDSESSDSDSEDSLQRTPAQSDSESDSDSGSKTKSHRRQQFDSDTDSDSDSEQSDQYFRPTQCLNSSILPPQNVATDKNSKPVKKLVRSNSKLNLSLRKFMKKGSKLDLSLRKFMKGSKKTDSASNKGAKSNSKICVPELKASPKRVLPKRPPLEWNKTSSLKKSSSVDNNSMILSKNTNTLPLRYSSSLTVNKSLCDNFCDPCTDSDSSSFSRSRSGSDSSGSSFRGCSGIKLGNSVKKLHRSKSDCSNKPQLVFNKRLNISQPLDNPRSSRQVVSNSPALQIRSHSMAENHCEIDIDTCKSPLEVRQSMEKTAFWIENNDYDKTPDVSSTESLLQTSRDVTESDLCNQIIGIYFGEENDSDSSLSSSCLDNSMDTSLISDDLLSNVSSTRLETNLDDFSMATFVPAPYQTAEAKTRKIHKAEGVPERKVKSADTKMTKRTRWFLKKGWITLTISLQ